MAETIFSRVSENLVKNKIAIVYTAATGFFILLPFALLASIDSPVRLMLISTCFLCVFSLLAGLFWKKKILSFMAIAFGLTTIFLYIYDYQSNIRRECDYFKSCTIQENGFLCGDTEFATASGYIEKRCVDKGYWPDEKE